MTRTLVLTMAAVLLWSCSSDPCVEGATVACACTDGRSGAQMCTDGKLSACVCTAPPLTDGGARDADAADAPADLGVEDVGFADASPDAAADAEPDAAADATADAGPADAGFPPYCERFPVGYVEIAPGTFLMGSTDARRPRDSVLMLYEGESPQHRVEITRRFWIKETEVTQTEWEELMGAGNNPSLHTGCIDCPVEQVSWHAAVDFVNRLSAQCGLTACYPAMVADRDAFVVDLDCPGFRLPTEAEWEYAARAGTTTDVWASDISLDTTVTTSTVMDPIGWYTGNSGDMTQPVRRKLPNPWGLYDTAGNVSEWVSDGFRIYDTALPVIQDPQGPVRAALSVYRGGSAYSSPIILRSAMRAYVDGAGTSEDIGFRIARTVR